MITTPQKQEIVQSLNNLDPDQSEKVLNYIHGLLYVQRNEFHRQNLKRHQAMEEISQALRQVRKFNQSF